MGASSGLVGALGGLTETDTNAPKEPLDWADIENGYPRYVPIQDVSLNEEERLMWVDLTPYMNRTPNTVQGHATAARAFLLVVREARLYAYAGSDLARFLRLLGAISCRF